MTSHHGTVTCSKPVHRSVRKWQAPWLRSLLTALAVVAAWGAFPPSAYANVAAATATCSQVTFTFQLFPSTGTNTINETVSVDGAQVASTTYTFMGSTSSNNIAIAVPAGGHTVTAHADWNSNGVSGAYDVTQAVSCNCATTMPSMNGAKASGSAYDIGATVLNLPLIKPPLAAASSSQAGIGTDAHSSGPLLPVNLPGPVQVNLLQSVSTSTIDSTTAADESISTTGAINLLNLVKATALRADARAWASPTSASFSTAGSGIDGLTVAGAAVQSIYPNEVIPLPGGGTVTLLEQTGTTGNANSRSTADLSVNLIHVRIPQLGTDIVVGHAEAHASAPLATLCPGLANGTVSAEAFAAQVSQGLIPSLNTIAVDDIAIPASGGSGSVAAQSFGVALNGVTIGSGTVQQEVDGTTDTTASNASATSTVQSLCLLNTTFCDPVHGYFPTDGIALSAATAASFSNAGGGHASSWTAGTTIGKLSINGQVIDPLALPPNTTYSIPGVATVILNEQIGEAGSNWSTDIGETVNILHVRLLIGGADVIISSAHSDAHHR